MSYRPTERFGNAAAVAFTTHVAIGRVRTFGGKVNLIVKETWTSTFKYYCIFKSLRYDNTPANKPYLPLGAYSQAAEHHHFSWYTHFRSQGG